MAGRPLLIGEAPAPSRNAAALDGPAGERLARYAGMASRAELLAAFDARNVLGRWPGPAGKGSAWPAARARRAAARKPLRGVCVLLGGRVAAAYGLGGLGWGTSRAPGSSPAGCWPRPLPSPIAALYSLPYPDGLEAPVPSCALETCGGDVSPYFIDDRAVRWQDAGFCSPLHRALYVLDHGGGLERVEALREAVADHDAVDRTRLVLFDGGEFVGEPVHANGEGVQVQLDDETTVTLAWRVLADAEPVG